MDRIILFSALLLSLFWLGCKETSDKTDGDNYNLLDEEGRKQGIWRYYYTTGELKSEIIYENGVKTGTEIQYYPSGQENIRQQWTGDTFGVMLHGPYYHYYETGQLLHEMYYVEGIPDSTFTFYYDDGQVEREGAYDKGVKTGVWSYYNPEGNLILTIDYENHGQYWTEDEKAGIFTWYRSGNPYYKAIYTADRIVEDSVLIPTIYEAKKDSLIVP